MAERESLFECRPHYRMRTLKGYLNQFTRRWVDTRAVEELDRDHPWIATHGTLTAIGQTPEAAMGMVFSMLRRRAA